MQNNMCSYESCLTCSSPFCQTGQIARRDGKDAYEAHLAMLDEAEKASMEQYEKELQMDLF